MEIIPQNKSKNTWKLRDEIFTATHRWYEIVLFFLIGAALGWLISLIWPAPYRATIDLYVGLNAYRSPYDSYVANVAQQEFRMVDDYKNWQMRQLNELVLTDPYLQETLDRLIVEDIYWQHISTQDLRSEMLNVMWRNAGEWHLIADGNQKERVVQAVQAWQKVIFEKVTEAISHSQKVVALDIKMTNLVEKASAAKIRQTELAYVSEQLLNWQIMLQERPIDSAITAGEHWQILGLVSQAANWTPVWTKILDDSPEQGATSNSYLAWLDAISIVITEELAGLPPQLEMLNVELAGIEQVYIQETERSQALASTLVIERVSDENPTIERLRPTGILMILGGFIGLFSWAILLLTRISTRKDQPK